MGLGSGDGRDVGTVLMLVAPAVSVMGKGPVPGTVPELGKGCAIPYTAMVVPLGTVLFFTGYSSCTNPIAGVWHCGCCEFVPPPQPVTLIRMPASTNTVLSTIGILHTAPYRSNVIDVDELT